MEKIKILVADDHGVLRAGLNMLLNSQPDMEVIGEVANGREVLESVEKFKPDVVLMDIKMPEMNGLEATTLISRKFPSCKVLVLTMYEDESYLIDLLQKGASGYIPKKCIDAELVSAIRSVYEGKVYVHPSMTSFLVREYLMKSNSYEKAPKEKRLELSEREMEILKLVAYGHTQKEIAETLYLSPKTIETYKTRIMEKLALKTRAELVRYAVDRGLLKRDFE